MDEHVRPLRVAHVVSPEKETLRPFVRCARRGDSFDAFECVECNHLRSMKWTQDGGTVTCSDNGEEPTHPGIHRRADLLEAAARTPLHEVVRPSVTCVTRDVSIEMLKRLVAERGLRAVAVVDDKGKLEGVVSRTDLTTAATFGQVGDMMSAHPLALPEGAPVASAIALMAVEDVSEVPVVTAEGQVIGIYHALDALRWVAGRMGYAESLEDAARGKTSGES